MMNRDEARDELLEIADRLEAWATTFQLSPEAFEGVPESLMKREGAPSHSLPHAEIVADYVRSLRQIAAELPPFPDEPPGAPNYEDPAEPLPGGLPG